MTTYIATDADSIAIHAIGATEDEARANALRDCGPLFDAEGNDLPENEALARFSVREATPALIAQVEAEGGAIAWGALPDGTACTVAEEDAALGKEE